TWVSSEPWGYAPYHYGRWVSLGSQWYWIPDRVDTTPSYSPALVAFLPIDQNDIGWVALGPGDPYVARYYDRSWQPTYLNGTTIVQNQVVNLNTPGAATVIPIDDFLRGDWRHVRRADQASLAQVHPVLDPLTVTPLRNAVVHSPWGRGKRDLPPGIAKKLEETPVVANAAPTAPPFRRDLRQALRVENVPEKVKGQKFKVRDERQNVGANQAPINPRGPEQSHQATQGEGKPEQNPNNNAERRIREAQPQQQPAQPEQPRGQAKRQMRAEPPARVEQPRVQGERVGQPARGERKQKVERPQAPRNAPAPERVRPQPPARVERPPKQQSAPRPQVAPQPQPKMSERGNPSGQQQGKGHGQGAGQKQERPAAPAKNNGGGGKGKNKKP